MQNESVLQKPYLNERVTRAVDAADEVRKNYADALKSLQSAQRTRDNLLKAQEKAAQTQLDEALAKLEKVRGDIAAQHSSPQFMLKTARGAEEKLRLAKSLPFLSDARRKALESDKKSRETLRYVALARYLVGFSDPSSSQQRPTQGLFGDDNDTESSSNNSSSSLLSELSRSMSADESDLSDEERENALQFKQRLLSLIRQMQADRERYEQALVEQDLLQMQLDQLDTAATIARQAVTNADPADSDPRLQRLRGELAEFDALQQRLQRLIAQRSTETLQLQLQTTGQEIARLVHAQRGLALEQVIGRLAASVRAELDGDLRLAATESASLQDALDKVVQKREELSEATRERIDEANRNISSMEEALAESLDAYADVEQQLRDALPELKEVKLWPTSLQGERSTVEQAIVAALKQFNIEVLKLENAKPDDIDPVTGKHKSCSPPFTLSQYQRALMHYVNDGFEVLPGVLLLWEPGTGKTQGSVSAAVENLRVRFVERNGDKAVNQAGAVDVLILGFTEDNLNDFRKTLLRTLDDVFGEDGYSVARESGNIKAGDLTIQLRIVGSDGTARPAIVAIQRYSVGARRANEMRIDPNGILLLDEAHFMSTRDVPTESTNRRQVLDTVAAWEKKVVNFTGVKLLLTATPSGANRDPEMLLKLLKYLPPQRGGAASAADKRSVTAHKNWFRERADGLGYEWVDGARQEFERDWLRARISFIALRFDKRVFPQVEARCAGAADNEQCVYEVNENTLTLANERPPLTQADQEARRLLDYARMAPMLVRVPLSAKEIKGLDKDIRTASLNTRNPELADCATDGSPLKDFDDDEVEECARYAHYAHKKGGGQWASGGGFDIESKVKAIRQVIDIVREKRGPTRHVVIASGYEGASRRYFQAPFLEEFTKAGYERVDKKHVRDDAAAQKLLQKAASKRRYASLTGGTYTRSTAVKTSAEKQRMKQVFFSDANRDGSIIEVLVVDASMLTGFDAKGATHLHIASPVLNQQQAWSRILRRCAQPVADAVVYVYTYTSYVPESVKEKTKSRVHITPDEIVLESLKRKRQKTQPIDLMRDAMRNSAFDRYFFADYSTGGAVSGALEEGETPVQALTQHDYVLWQVVRAAERQEPQMPKRGDQVPPPLPPQADEMEQFAQEFFVGEPWRVAAPVRLAGANMDDAKAERIADTLVAVLRMNLLSDLALLRAFMAQRLSANKRQQLAEYLDRKAAATPPALMKAYENYYRLQLAANRHYQNIVSRTVGLYDRVREQRADLLDAADDLSQRAAPELPPTPKPALPPRGKKRQSTMQLLQGPSRSAELDDEEDPFGIFEPRPAASSPGNVLQPTPTAPELTPYTIAPTLGREEALDFPSPKTPELEEQTATAAAAEADRSAKSKDDASAASSSLYGTPVGSLRGGDDSSVATLFGTAADDASFKIMSDKEKKAAPRLRSAPAKL